MSLHQLANHMAAHGRGPDDRLVHMSGKEIAGLQALAQAHGGSLTRNPHTGLPEAGFLDDILPVALGAAAMYFTGGAAAPEILGGVSNAALIGGGVGALQTARTGDLGKGIMAGLGAYGGAGLTGAGMEAGLLSESPQSVTNTVPQAASLEAPVSAGNAGFTPGVDAGTSLSEMSAPNGVQNSFVPGVDAGTTLSEASSAPVAPAQPTWGSVISQNGKYAMAAAAPGVMSLLSPKGGVPTTAGGQMVRPYTFASNGQTPTNMIGTKYMPGQDTSERQWFQPQYTPGTPYTPVAGKDYAAGGPIDGSGGGPVEQMSNNAAIGANTMYPMANMTTSAFATPYQSPQSTNMIAPSGGATVDSSTGELNPQGTRLAGGGLFESSLADAAKQVGNGSSGGPQDEYNMDEGFGPYIQRMQKQGRLASGGGISTLGGYSDGGRLLRGPGDGMSDDIPAQIGHKQPARLADGEFVVPADVVSHLGNGSTDAGAKQLYHMMDKIRQARTGRKAQGKQIKPSKFMPA